MAKILIVDDESDIVSALTIRLESLGYEIISAEDGITALEKARSEKPDLILLDVMLPKLDGYKVCRMLKFDEKYKDIPIIIITAKGEELNRRMGMDMGANAYITKPFKPEDLTSKIKELLTKK